MLKIVFGLIGALLGFLAGFALGFSIGLLSLPAYSDTGDGFGALLICLVIALVGGLLGLCSGVKIAAVVKPNNVGVTHGKVIKCDEVWPPTPSAQKDDAISLSPKAPR